MKKQIKAIIYVDIIFIALLAFFLFSLPKPLFLTPTSYVIEASNGELLSASIAKDGQWRFPVADSIPDKFAKCIVTFEDKRFYHHFGVDFIAVGRAIRQNIEAKSVASGASTLSMQVIRLSRKKQRTFFQKIAEMWLAVRLEVGYSKDEILALYAANAPFGSNVVGLEAASWRYYGRAAEQLSWGEMATLAVLPNTPSLVHPGKNATKLIIKRNNLLDKLVDEKIIDRATAQLSKAEPIPTAPLPLPQHAPHLLNRFKDEMKSLNIATTRITSTIDEHLQQELNQVTAQYHQKFAANGINNLAALVINVKNGSVVGYVGNCYLPKQKDMESHVDMIRARRSPGSTLKPLLYASMLNDGFILPQTLIPDVPTQIGGYSPMNFDLGYDGAIPADRALSRSLNIPAVKMLQQYKYERFYDKLKKFNFSTLNKPADHYGLSLILGGSEVTMWDLSNAYLGMARTLNHYNDYQGKYNNADYTSAYYVKDAKDPEDIIDPTSLLDHGTIWSTFNAMEEVMRPGDEGLWQQFSSSQRIAWKTGTSFGFRDAWSVGLTPNYVVCVWVGNADGEGRPGLTGIEAAAPLMFDIFRLLPSSKWFEMPKTKLKRIAVCKQSGYKASSICETKVVQWVPPSGEKTALCPYHKLIHLDASANYQVTNQCYSVTQMKHQGWFILLPTMEYYYKTKNAEYRVLPPFMDGCQNESASVMEMIYPKPNASVYIPLEIDGNRGKVVFNVAHRNNNATIHWHIDEEYVGTTKSYHQIALSPKPGKHVLTLTDQNGERLVQSFTVLDKEKEK
ncbi:penicillin-binding protein 1C [Pedobacter xixiisoli]|uniref:peptidoglycan glycosyltransferase n=1 Tax=Pedobacter xixiisoli TaxID=1476464 RepID=A0A285ZTJ9_9SPHI|nr:penicillin-binding protein 1C [Pedobacter xixiisoli]SOD12956.1 penicillin-binding protein 1C [Pedobacter xixiisoli]